MGGAVGFHPVTVAPGHAQRLVGHVVSGEPLRFEQFCAGALLVLLGMRFYLLYEVTAAAAVAALLLPVWALTLREFEWSTRLMVLFAVASASGVVLSLTAQVDHGVHSRSRVLDLVLVLSIPAGIGVVLWARTLMSNSSVAVLFGLGMLLAIRPNAGVLENPWKFGFSLPVSVLALALVTRFQSRVPAVAMAFVLALVSALSDARSRSAILLIVALVMVWQAWPRPRSSRTATLRVLLSLAVLGVAAYQLGQALISEGLLGVATAERTAEQIAQSGSLILGGRPEVAATWALMNHSLRGFGFGIEANWQELLVARTGLEGINYDPNNRYVTGFMFGSGVELHSALGDYWAWMGVVGLALGLVVLAVVVVRLSAEISHRAASGVVLLAGLTIVWDTCFSPLKTSVPILILGVGLLLRRRHGAAGLDPGSHPD